MSESKSQKKHPKEDTPQTMDHKIEKIISIAGSKHRYQYMMLFASLVLWMGCNFTQFTLQYLERMPLIRYTNPKTKSTIETALTYEICEQNIKYEIINAYPYSIVTYLGIQCDRFKTGLISSVAFIGTSLGAFLYPFFLNFAKNHKNCIIVGCVLFNIAIFFMTLIQPGNNGYRMFLAALFTAGIFDNILSYDSISVCQEIVCTEKRSFFGTMVNFGYSLGGILFSLVFMLLFSFKVDFYILMGLIFACIFFYYFIMLESPRLYISNGDTDKLVEVLRGTAKFNGLSEEFEKQLNLPDNKQILDDIKENFSNTEEKKVDENEENPNEKTLINRKRKRIITKFDLFRYKSTLVPFLIHCCIWFSAWGILSTATVSSKSLPGNFYVNNIILFTLECIGIPLSAVLMETKSLGRRGSTFLGFFIMMVILFCLRFLNIQNELAIIVLNSLIRLFVAGTSNILTVYSLESFPTAIRPLSYGLIASSGNCGGIIVPMINEFFSRSQMYLILMAYSAISCFLIVTFLDETYGKPPVEDIKEMKDEVELEFIENPNKNEN